MSSWMTRKRTTANTRASNTGVPSSRKRRNAPASRTPTQSSNSAAASATARCRCSICSRAHGWSRPISARTCWRSSTGCLTARGLTERCIAVAMDAQKNYVRPGSADLVVGSAILHHLVEPAPFVEQAMRILRPGGAAIFFEPFEGGYAILRLICQEIVREAGRRNDNSPAVDLARRVAIGLAPQIFRDALPGWQARNDKWMFPRVVDRRARAPSRRQPDGLPDPRQPRPIPATVHLYDASLRRPRRPTDLPAWAAEIFDRYDREAFSPQMLTDLAMEGCIIFAKPKAARRSCAAQCFRIKSAIASTTLSSMPRNPCGVIAMHGSLDLGGRPPENVPCCPWRARR